MLSSIPFKLMVILALSHLVHSNIIDGQKGSTKEIFKGTTFLPLKKPKLLRYSVRCVHAVIVKFTNIEVGILKRRPRTLDFLKTPT